jgi:hypothetical protein
MQNHRLSSLNDFVHGNPFNLLSFFLAHKILFHIFIFHSQRFSLQGTRHFECHPKQSKTLKAQSSSHFGDKETKNSNFAYKCKVQATQSKENTLLEPTKNGRSKG